MSNKELTAEEQDKVTFVTSLLFFTVTIILCRFMVSRISFLAASGRKTAAKYLMEFVTAFQLCACSIENSTLLRRYGMPTYLTVLFCQLYWNSVSLPAGFSGNACQKWRQFLAGEIRLGGFAGRVACQVLGGQAAFWFARSYWSIGLTASHAQRLAFAANCVSDLTVPGFVGFGLEFVGVFADSLLLAGLAAFTARDSRLRNEEVQRLCFCLLGTWLTYHGLPLSGMYANPINASAQTFGCHGNPLWLQFAVYWLAPLLAASLGHRLEALLPRPVNESSRQGEKEE